MKANGTTEAEVMSVLNKLIEAHTSKDMDGALACYTSDPNLVYIGTGVDEKHLGLSEVREQLERDFAQTESLSADIMWSSVSAAGSVAWVAADIMIGAKSKGEKISFPGRFTAVLEKKHESKWFIMQRHFSIPASEQAWGESLPRG